MAITIELLPPGSEVPAGSDADTLFADTGDQEPDPHYWMTRLPEHSFHAGVDCHGGGLLQAHHRKHRQPGSLMRIVAKSRSVLSVQCFATEADRSVAALREDPPTE